MRRIQSRSAARHLLALTVTLVSACERDPGLTAAPITLVPDRWYGITGDELVARGPVTEVCLDLPGAYRVRPLQSQLADDGRGRRVELTSGRVAVAVGRLVTPSGRHVTLGPATLSTWPGGSSLCFHARPAAGSVYRRIELSASDTLTIDRVHWWSGERKPLLP